VAIVAMVVMIVVVAAMMVVIAVMMMVVVAMAAPVPAAAVGLLDVPVAEPAPFHLVDYCLAVGNSFDRSRQRDRCGLRRDGRRRSGEDQRCGRQQELHA
jgi:hypothetical protein